MEARPGVGDRSSWCELCYLKWETRRSNPEAQQKLYARFDAKVEQGFPCWRWKAAVSDTGYGSIGVEGKTCYAHRIAYERYKGSIPPGFDIDHLCRNRWCVNPDHLEAVPRTINLRRGLNGVLKKTCAQGHPWTEEHIYHRPGSGKKMCGTCSLERARVRSRT
jgi:hypothetical protein